MRYSIKCFRSNDVGFFSVYFGSYGSDNDYIVDIEKVRSMGFIEGETVLLVFVDTLGYNNPKAILVGI